MSSSSQDPVLQRARARVDHYLEQYPTQPPNDKAIHQLRGLIKHLRGYLQLYPRRCKAARRAADHKLKVLAHGYAGLRDVQVQHNTLRKLCRKASAKQQRQLRSLQSLLAPPKPHRNNQHPDPPAPDTALAEILDHWPCTAMTANDINAGLERMERKVRKHGGMAVASGDDDQLHRWRKWIKYWRYCLKELNPEHSAKQCRTQKKLATGLGQYHDWQMLETALHTNPESQQHRQALAVLEKRLAKKRKKRLCRFARGYKKLTSRSCPQDCAVIPPTRQH